MGGWRRLKGWRKGQRKWRKLVKNENIKNNKKEKISWIFQMKTGWLKEKKGLACLGT